MLSEKNLHNYQRHCIKHALEHPYCGLFLDMGLGKTAITLTVINKLMYEELEVDSTLIVAPKRVAENTWAEEAANWTHLSHLKISKVIGNEKKRIEALHKKADIYVISRDNVAWLVSYYGTKLPFDMYVFDELSSFKSPKSIRFKALKAARPFFKRVIGLTGTPASNGLIDLWSQMYLIDMGGRLEKSITRYRDKYFNSGQTNGHVVYNYVIKGGAEDMIHEKISDICISMKAKDYLELPERVDNYISLYMPDSIKKQYDQFEKEKVLEMINADEAITVLTAASLSNKLLQFANGAVYDGDRCVHEVHDIKLEALKGIIEEAQGNPVLVAWAFQHDRDRIKRYLSSYGVRELKTSQDMKDWNDGKIQVLIAHPASVGHGLNLQRGGNIIVWYGLTYSLELYMQFNARLHRQGQSSSVIVHHLVMKGTHDEDVIKSLERKDMKQEWLLDAIKAKISKYLKK